ncbi:MAG: glycosyltransferase family 4 protein [Patescibacteria group bacterium]
MRVLILTTEYLPKIGGSELAIKNLTKRLPQVQFTIISGGWKWLLPIIGFLRALRYDFDIIHVFQASYAGGAGVLLKLFHPKTPFIVSLQEGKQLEKQSFFVRFFRSVILRNADVITAISSHLLNYANSINPKAARVLLPNGVDVRNFSHTGSEYIVTSSRLVEKNGIDTLIQAMVFLPGERLHIIGDGPMRKQLESLAKRLGVADRVRFIGAVLYDDLPPHLASASVFVRPSRSEGLGIAFLDAMAAGVPIVGTPVGGIPDFLKDRETGLFCKPEDPQSVAHAVREIIENNELRKNITDRARSLVEEKYNWDMLAKKYYEIIRHYSRI